MATTKKTIDAVTENSTAGASEVKESLYTIDEFANVAEELFGAGTSSELVTVALELAGKEMFTKKEAVTIVEAFKKKEVK